MLFSLLLAVVILFNFTESQQIESLSLKNGENDLKDLNLIAGTNTTILCRAKADLLLWQHRHRTINTTEKYFLHHESENDGILSELTILSISLHDSGHYYCIAKLNSSEKLDKKSFYIHVEGPPTLVKVENSTVAVGHKGKLSCTFHSNPAPDVVWLRDKAVLNDNKRFITSVHNKSALYISTVTVDNVTLKDNGTYECHGSNKIDAAGEVGKVNLIVQGLPSVSITQARALGPSDVQVEWELKENNAPLKDVEILISEDKSDDFKKWKKYIFINNGIVIVELPTSSKIRTKLKLSNVIGNVETDVLDVAMLQKKPYFVPKASFKGKSKNSLSVGWNKPDDELIDYVKYYLLTLTDLTNGRTKESVVYSPKTEHFFEDLKISGKYNFSVSSCTSSSYCSSATRASCAMPESFPSPEKINWRKYASGNKVFIKMDTPKISERNGTVCCYRVTLIKLGRGLGIGDLPSPSEIVLNSYQDVHNSQDTGALLREKDFLLLGDGKVTGNWSKGCGACLGLSNVGVAPLVADATTSAALRFHRSLEIPLPVEDGELSSDNNYTGFVSFTVYSNRSEGGRSVSSYSSYLPILKPVADDLPSATTASAEKLETEIVYVAAGIFALLLLVSIAMCSVLCFYRRKNKQLEDEINVSMSGSLGSLRRSHTLMSHTVMDIKPIPKDELVAQYLEKVKDNELGFRKEFEALPEKFYDRCTRASEMVENSTKNRYPDIRAYDQTRVKLSMVDDVTGSDYINANYVLGYKDRKKFICAQGPMEATVNDFWRMIVEQACRICVMLTNLEETGKIKCVKYWSEAGQPETFDKITVRLVREKVYADYIVRMLRAEWESSSADGTKETKCHEVEQYHYLIWKDFVAPEHATGVLAFLRRINEAYSCEKGPLLVHCSAGVGRTGSLVALDYLVSELEEEGQASIFNVVCDLRHQRNFLVQSLKQYVFIHRALMEFAQFGNTELTSSELKDNWNTHTQHDSSHEVNCIEKEFELLGKVIEDRRALTIATSDENKAKNRHVFALPYDSNRVILAPISGISSTYINASFVNDPLEHTVADFWRMMFDQDLGSGENCCAKYWPDEEEEHEHLAVKLTSSESYPKYSVRCCTITNNKNNEVLSVTQFHYIGWTGPVGEVPLVTNGIMELITRVQSHIDANISTPSPVVVHCTSGGDRSSVYLCLNNCMRQLRREGRVDIFQIARRIRAQRQFQLQELAQYEFCYKALVEHINSRSADEL